MTTPIVLIVLCAFTILIAAPVFGGDPAVLPVRGLHVMAPRPDELSDSLRFIREALPREGVNVLVVEFGYRYQFTKRPEVIDSDALSRDNVKSLAEAQSQVFALAASGHVRRPPAKPPMNVRRSITESPHPRGAAGTAGS